MKTEDKAASWAGKREREGDGEKGRKGMSCRGGIGRVKGRRGMRRARQRDRLSLSSSASLVFVKVLLIIYATSQASSVLGPVCNYFLQHLKWHSCGTTPSFSQYLILLPKFLVMEARHVSEKKFLGSTTWRVVLETTELTVKSTPMV